MIFQASSFESFFSIKIFAKNFKGRKRFSSIHLEFLKGQPVFMQIRTLTPQISGVPSHSLHMIILLRSQEKVLLIIPVKDRTFHLTLKPHRGEEMRDTPKDKRLSAKNWFFFFSLRYTYFLHPANHAGEMECGLLLFLLYKRVGQGKIGISGAGRKKATTFFGGPSGY